MFSYPPRGEKRERKKKKREEREREIKYPFITVCSQKSIAAQGVVWGMFLR